MRHPSRDSLIRLPGTTLLGTFLVATLGLSLWLGYQALDAARSHRRTAEATLRDHAGISAWELSRRARDNLDEVLDDVFDPVYRRLRGDDLPSAGVVGWDMDDAVQDQRCRCPAFRRPIALFRVTLPSREVTSEPPGLPASTFARLGQRILDRSDRFSRRDEGFLVVSDEGLAPEPVVVGYSVARDSELDGAIYGFVVSREAMAELFDTWYQAARLLPRPVAGDLPNDSLLTVSVRSPEGVELFASPAAYPETFAAADTLGPAFGDLVVEAAIRPDAASQLVIGGLPKSRLPLLITLLVLTLGVGGAAFLQIRRERELALLRDDFISGVSHELRTPLAQIRMFAELQQSGVLSSEADRARAAGVINREARRLTHLVENILQYSRLRRTPDEDGPLTEEVDVDEVLAESVEAVGPMADSRHAELSVDGEPGTRVLANRTALSQILVNLLDNAVKYGPPDQTVTVDVEARDGVVRFTVDDEGPGIPPRDRDRIWEPYRRLPRDVNSRLPGTGVGLAVVARLARAHGGRTRVEESPAGGARFVVELPRAGAGAGSAAMESGRGGDSRAPAGTDGRGAGTPAASPAAGHDRMATGNAGGVAPGEAAPDRPDASGDASGEGATPGAPAGAGGPGGPSGPGSRPPGDRP